MAQFTIRPATIADSALILQFIRELATFENAAHEVQTTLDHVQSSLFCDNPKVFSLICRDGATPVGFAVYFFNYSTWQGRHGLYLEDLYVSPARRSAGAGTALLRRLAQIAVERDCGRLEWSVLDWNTQSIDFYDRLGAEPQSEWIRYRMSGQALLDLARA